MATYYKALENIPDERYHDIIVNPLLDCLKDRGILLDSSQSPKTYDYCESSWEYRDCPDYIKRG